jgi:spore germination cell wall hydrolase CwlJ-like protein
MLGASFADGHPYTDRLSVVSTPLSEQVQAQSPVELAAVKQTREQQCLAEVMYYEARGEGIEGQEAVAEVVLARMNSRLYPDTICDVVYQGAERATGCQFSFTCDGSMKRRKESEAWEKAELMAAKIVNGSLRLPNRTKNALSFHTTDVEPVWSHTMLRVTQVGNHIFYRHMPKSMRAQIKTETAEETAITQPEQTQALAGRSSGDA